MLSSFYAKCSTLNVMLLCLVELYVGDIPFATDGMTRFEIYGRHVLGRGEGSSEREENRHGKPNELYMKI